METHWAEIIKGIGEDLDRPGLVDTPKRAAKAFQFLTRGYDQSLDEVVNNALFPSDSNEMVLVQNIELYSLCEHHMLPSSVSATLLTYPRESAGAIQSCQNRRHVCRRLQIQNR